MKGILHVGAHECEEKDAYNTVWEIGDEHIIWVDANDELISKNIERGIPNCYTAALDEVERDATFYVTNNSQSSSLLDLGLHSTMYPDIVVAEKRATRTQTLAQFFERNGLDPCKYNVWNFDIQGAEYAVFKGSEHMLKYADVIYCEVSTSELYMGCAHISQMNEILEKNGFSRAFLRMCEQDWGDALYIRNS